MGWAESAGGEGMEAACADNSLKSMAAKGTGRWGGKGGRGHWKRAVLSFV